MQSWQLTAVNVVRGGLIGTVEVVPGVSGGTVALIVGVYETLITSAGHILGGLRYLVSDLPRGRGTERAGAEFSNVHWPTLLPVAAGMLVAVVLVARQMEDFVQDHPELARGLFLGLVGAAVVVPISMVGRQWRASYVVAAAIAAVAAFIVTGWPPTEVEPSRVVILVSGAAAVSALILPGLSGSFVLLTIGLYQPTLAALNDRDFGYLVWFIAGLVIGLALFVRVLQWLLEHRHAITLAVMTGLMVGCMRALWPWQDEDRALHAPGDNVATVALLFVLGVLAVGATLYVGYRARRPRRPVGAHARR
jgi:putative membrane protein